MLFLLQVDRYSGRWEAMPFATEPDTEVEETRELAEYLLFAAAFEMWSDGAGCFVNVPDELVSA